MRRAIAAIAVTLLFTGCFEEEQPEQPPVKQGPSFQQQQEALLRKELDKIQAQADKSIQKGIETGQIVTQANKNIQKDIETAQNKLKSAKPKFPSR